MMLVRFVSILVPLLASSLAAQVAIMPLSEVKPGMKAIGKTVFEEMFATGKNPEKIIEEKGLVQVSDTSAIETVIDEVLAKNADSLAKYRSGKLGLFGFFVGEAMKATKGQASPKVVNEILKKKLG